MSHDPSPPGATPPEPAPAAAAASAIDAVRDYGDVAGEYSALRHDPAHGPVGGAILVDRSYRSRGTFAGPKARDVITGLVTNDVLALAPGAGCYAAALTPKGKILSDARILVRDDDVLVDVPPRAAAGWWGMVRKYVNPRLSRYADITASTVDLSVYGTRAHAVVAAALGVQWESLADMAPFAHRQLVALGHTLQLIRVPDLQLEGFAIIAPIAARDTLWASLRASGAHPAGLDAFEIARIEAGRPEWGIEMDDATLAQEANMEELHAVSFTKGCYTGQETVARVHFRGHVNRHLRGLRFDEAHMLTRGSGLRDAGDKSVGDVRSAVISPRLGGVALAMVRREIEVDSEVEVVAAESTVRARVVALPFPLG